MGQIIPFGPVLSRPEVRYDYEWDPLSERTPLIERIKFIRVLDQINDPAWHSVAQWLPFSPNENVTAFVFAPIKAGASLENLAALAVARQITQVLTGTDIRSYMVNRR